MRRRALALAIALAAVLALPGAALAACPKTSVADLEDEVMCPVCGTSLAVAIEAPQAKRERAFILEQVERCRSKEEIKAALAAEFGDDVLATPEARGFDLAAYLVPVLALLAGAGAVGAAALRWRREGAGGGGTPGGAVSAEEARRLEADLERYD